MIPPEYFSVKSGSVETAQGNRLRPSWNGDGQ